MYSLKKVLTTMVVGATVLCGAMPALAAASYTVNDGDTLWTIAKSHHISLDQLQSTNPNVNALDLLNGTKLTLPGSPSLYTARVNDTLWTIARAHGMSVATLEKLNPSVNPRNVYPGLAIHLSSTNSSAPVVPHVTEGATQQPSVSADRVVTASGQALSYSKVIHGTATAYTASAASNGHWGAIDYFGKPLHIGTIAVDPSVIPLGSKLYVTGYTYSGLPVGGLVGAATDEGSAVKGSHIDLFVPDSDSVASDFGIQNVTIYVLK